jgi:anti-anti-sigma factor
MEVRCRHTLLCAARDQKANRGRKREIPGGFLMTTTILNPAGAAMDADGERRERTELTELIRGREEGLLAWLAPLVCRQSVTLDLSAVRRIDAAGVAVLLNLYTSAREAGHRFAVANPTHRVAEILGLVGLDRILVSHNVVRKPYSGHALSYVAA